jgi:hypothetical protein
MGDSGNDGRGSFVSGGRHREAPVTDLEQVLDEYDRRIEASGQRVEGLVSSTPSFPQSFVAWRESLLRPVLEDVGWHLELRGHHPWVELLGEETAGELVETLANRSAGADESVAGLAFCLVLSGHIPGRGEQAQLSFTCDTASELVEVSGLFPNEKRPTSYLLADVNEQQIYDIATTFVANVALGTWDRPAPQPEASAPTSDADTVADLPTDEEPADHSVASATGLPHLDLEPSDIVDPTGRH